MSSTPDDLRRIFLGSTLFRLDTLVATRLIPILYAVGLLGILVWAINHLFLTFGSNFGNGLWGLVEIAVFGLLWLLLLRLVCEGLMVFFRTHDAAVHSMRTSRMSATLLEDVRDAIHDLAEEEDSTAVTITEPVPTRRPRPPAPPAPAAAPPAPVVRRTAKRTPPATPAVITPPAPPPPAAPPVAAASTIPATPPATPVAPPPPATPPARPEDDDV